jgi:hypothetical protein
MHVQFPTSVIAALFIAISCVSCSSFRSGLARGENVLLFDAQPKMVVCDNDVDEKPSKPACSFSGLVNVSAAYTGTYKDEVWNCDSDPMKEDCVILTTAWNLATESKLDETRALIRASCVQMDSVDQRDLFLKRVNRVLTLMYLSRDHLVGHHVRVGYYQQTVEPFVPVDPDAIAIIHKDHAAIYGGIVSSCPPVGRP